jgi:pseudouridine synthase
MKIVLQKYISSSGYCSRRQAESLIRDGEVLVNGNLAELGMKVDEDDEVKIDNEVITPSEEKIYIKLNKPVGYTCTNRTFEGEKNVFELLQVEERGLFIVGRLDKNSHGLVIISNDGDWTEKVTHPRYEHEKEYLVQLRNFKNNLPINKIIKKIRKGVDIGDDDGVVRVKKVEHIDDNEFKIILTQGKKRQIRRMFDVIGEKVIDLKRVRIGDINLGDLKEGESEEFKK